MQRHMHRCVVRSESPAYLSLRLTGTTALDEWLLIGGEGGTFVYVLGFVSGGKGRIYHTGL